jgi:hypothetical protein
MRRRLPPAPEVEPPAWVRYFEPADWVRAGDWPAGCYAGDEQGWMEHNARRRWHEARYQWAADNAFPLAEWVLEDLKERQRRRRAAAEPTRRAHR